MALTKEQQEQAEKYFAAARRMGGGFLTRGGKPGEAANAPEKSGEGDPAKSDHNLEQETNAQNAVVSAQMGNTPSTDGLIERAGMPSKGEITPEEKKRRAFEDFLRRKQIQEWIEALEREREALRVEWDQLKADLKEIEIKIAKAESDLDVIKNALDGYNNGLGFERNANGSMKDKQLEAVLRAHEQRTGQKLDLENDAMVAEALRQSRMHTEKEYESLGRERIEKEQREEKIKEEINKIDRQIDKLQKMNSENNDLAQNKNFENFIGTTSRETKNKLLANAEVPDHIKASILEMEKKQQETKQNSESKTAFNLSASGASNVDDLFEDEPSSAPAPAQKFDFPV